MKHIKLLLEYDGTAYQGWQIQKKGLTIQGVIEDRIFKITGRQSRVIGASRTDAGVHALGQVATFRTESRLDAETIKKALNAVLPEDIRVLDSSVVDDSFHPREDAVRKRYFYIITNQRISSAFLFRYTWIVPQALNLNSMSEASESLVGKHNFSAFMGTGSDIKDPVREIYSLNIEKLEKVDFLTACLKGNFMKISIEANGFLKHMVRNIVGILVEIGRGKILSDRIKEILELHDRRHAGPTAPPNGLFLERILY
ncbi:MAG: tRNA pseudouridine(38-40) synthase TruA [Nitrospira sp.]|nr:tRNA pseudouridine(38-40) synthase TruA [Nitrospira sp.]